MVQTHPMQRETLTSGAIESKTHLVAGVTYSVSCRGKKEAEDVGPFLATHFSHIPLSNIDSVFGFRERSTLYGGRQFLRPEFSDADITWLAERGVGLKLPLSNHMVSENEYAMNRPFLEKYHRHGNSMVVVNDKLARWIRRDYPDYSIEASVIKHILTHDGIDAALDLYDTVVLPMKTNNNLKFLEAIENKARIRLFTNGGCAYNCPLHICYKSVSKANKYNGKEDLRCSQSLLFRSLLGMVNFDVSKFKALGFSKFKILRSKGKTGF